MDVPSASKLGTFESTLDTADIDFSASGYPASRSTHKIADVLIESDYLINMPIMKKHGGAGITFSLKNHLGSINGFLSGGHTMHDYFYLGDSHYSAETNPIVDINSNTPPEKWPHFGNDSPNMLFFGVDPVAVDSVMFDHMDAAGYVNPIVA